MTVEQNVMCALLDGLLKQKVIGQDLHDTAKKQILARIDWPAFFCYGGKDGKENGNGNS